MFSDIELVIFDLDGTLIEFPIEFFLTEAARILPELAHPEVSRELLLHHFSSFDFFGFVDPRLERERFIEQYWRHFDWERFPKPVLLPGVQETLEQLRTNGIHTGIATARPNPPEEVRTDLLPTGLLPFIEAIETRESTVLDWMDKTPQISRLCAAFQVPPERTILVGDIPADVSSAHAAGLAASVAVLTGGIRPDVLTAAKPQLLLSSVCELIRYLSCSG